LSPALTEKMLILRKVRYGEADLILTCLNQHGRVMTLIAKSALKSKKRFGGGILEPTHYITATYTPPPRDSEKMGVLNEAVLIQDFQFLREDYEKLEYALQVLKTVAHVSHEGEMHSQKLFDLVGNAILAAKDSKHLGRLRTQFEVKFLNQQGVLPPENEYRPLMLAPLRDHAKISLSDEEWSALRARLRYHLDSYLT
jgi:DNA repair protein RecO (recombination protein O)